MSFKEMERLGNQPSVIRQLFEYGKQRKTIVGEDNVYDFSIGNPSVEPPQIVKDKLIELLENVNQNELHGYTSAAGNVNTRNAIAEYINKTHQVNEEGKYIYMTVGAAAAISIALKAVMEENDEVIVFAPFFPEYKVFVENAGGKLVSVKANQKTFQIDFDELEKSINKNTKVIIYNSPNNPSGVVYPKEDIIRLADLIKRKEKEYQHDIYILSDEPYRELVYSNIEVPFITKYYNNSFVCYSFSKSLSLPGERIGYVLVCSKMNNADAIFAAVCGAGRSLGYICAPSLFQHLIPYCLGKTSNIEEYKENLSILCNGLQKIGYEVVKPEGAFYLFVKCLEKDANAFSENAKRFELLLVPSDSFGVEGYVRVSYCVSKKTIINSLPAFEKLYKYYERG